MDASTTADSAAQRLTAKSAAWLSMLRRYLLFVAVVSLGWEVAQVPLYTIWAEGTVGEIVFAVLHCTGGDLLIAGASILGAVLVFGNGCWPVERHAAVATTATAAGVAFTVYSEWRNVEILGHWAYSDWMPTLPVIGTGLSPFAQWIVVPTAAFWWARRAVRLQAITRGGMARW